MTAILDLHEKWMKDPVYAQEYEALEGEFRMWVAAVVKARSRAVRKEKR